jgi:hypothetical protein
MVKTVKRKELIERLAAIEHQRWADWQGYLHAKLMGYTMATDDYNRWEKQIITSYDDLSEREKQSDRDEVERYLPLIEKYMEFKTSDGP